MDKNNVVIVGSVVDGGGGGINSDEKCKIRKNNMILLLFIGVDFLNEQKYVSSQHQVLLWNQTR